MQVNLIGSSSYECTHIPKYINYSTLSHLLHLIYLPDPSFISPDLISTLLTTLNKSHTTLFQLHSAYTGDSSFASVTYRMFKLPKEPLDNRMINSATYLGGILDHEEQFNFDHHMIFKVNLLVSLYLPPTLYCSTIFFVQLCILNCIKYYYE